MRCAGRSTQRAGQWPTKHHRVQQARPTLLSSAPRHLLGGSRRRFPAANSFMVSSFAAGSCQGQLRQVRRARRPIRRSEEHTSELQSLMRISYAVFCLKKKKKTNKTRTHLYDEQIPKVQTTISKEHK